jgi:repressor LexA
MTNDIGKRIAALRRERGFNQEELAEMAMVHRVTLAKYETGAIEPGAFAVSRIADALGVTTDELLCRVEKQPPFLQIARNAVPVIGEIACGTPITAEQNITGYADMPDGVHADFALKCKGDSMFPTFIDGDLVLIRQQPEVEDGQIAAVMLDGEATLKRFYRREDGVTLVADNPKFAPIFAPFGHDEQLTVCGRAVGYTRIFD